MVNYMRILLVCGSSRTASRGRSGHHVGGMFCCPMRFDSSSHVLLCKCAAAVLPVSGFISASRVGNNKKNIDFKKNVIFKMIVFFSFKTNLFAFPLAAILARRQPHPPYCLQALYASFVAARALLHNTNYNVRRSDAASLAQLGRDQASTFKLRPCDIGI